MKVRTLSIFVIASLFAFVVGSAQPNVVLIISDDQNWADYGFMGHPVIKTPHLDQLASEGVVYRYGYVPASLCRPSLATMVTGLYPHQHGVTGNDPARAEGVARRSAENLRAREKLIGKIDEVPTLPRLLEVSGYRSFQSGKWWEGGYERGGFTDGMTHGDPEQGGRHGDDGLKIGREGLQPIFSFIESAGESPFFIWYAPFMPHLPHDPPERLLEKYTTANRTIELSRYYAMCEWFDETVGELLGYFEEAGLAERTLIVFITDNGWIQRTSRMRLPSGWRPGYAPRSKQSANEGGIRTPIILRWPGRVEPAQVNIPVSSIDLAPTILRAAGLEPTRQMPGVNLLDRSAVGNRHTIFGDTYTHDVMDRLNPVASLKFRWCIRAPWKLIVPHAPNIQDAEVRLFDVVADPEETRNLALDYPALVEELHGQIQSWWRVD
jgi:uncharacterized sulfatase